MKSRKLKSHKRNNYENAFTLKEMVADPQVKNMGVEYSNEVIQDIDLDLPKATHKTMSKRVSK